MIKRSDARFADLRENIYSKQEAGQGYVRRKFSKTQQAEEQKPNAALNPNESQENVRTSENDADSHPEDIKHLIRPRSLISTSF